MSRIPDELGDIADADAGEWPKFILQHEEKIVHTHSWNTSWRIERHGIHQQKEDFSEDWTDVYPGPCKSDTAYVYHNNSPIYSKNIVLVDSAQAIIPYPTKINGDWKISQLEENIGAILTDDVSSFYDKLNSANIEVTDDTIRPR
ncbi:hypothetical protein GJ629_00160 [Halapricum sp. CBA1109]|uniref:hypothetical protein n=1 Tax=Halapricum sp. CBA1109 TaxID=2668068 RepID=UPI0012FB3A78|nr:hypothetical protein [Halapricum sp. CBA1109]MUV88489.1 hypothetical protein [Halapricum sp. CBA1109]